MRGAKGVLVGGGIAWVLLAALAAMTVTVAATPVSPVLAGNYALFANTTLTITAGPEVAAASDKPAQPIRIGSKHFNESYLLAETGAQLLESRGYRVERRFGLGGTLICFDALVNGEIDLYFEYTGTLGQAVLHLENDAGQRELNQALEGRGLRLLRPLGFNNTYAIAVRRQQAEALHLRSIGDLARHPQLKVVLSHEFIERGDGWPGLARAYGIDRPVTGIDHGLAYRAMREGALDVTDAYSTDAELLRHDLAILADDLGFFPHYAAAPLVRADIGQGVIDLLNTLAGSLDEQRMQALNASVKFDGRTFAEVAGEFLAGRGVATKTDQAGLWADLAANTVQHLKLTLVALVAAVLVGVGAGLAVFRQRAAARAVVYFCGLLQTIPSIALLALLIPLFGIGVLPAIVALFLYSLLPILRNTITALTTVDPTLRRVATAMGLSKRQRLGFVYVPLSLPSILAGIRTAAVISIGTATLAAFIGAGGLGDPIVTGLALNDMFLVLQGAVPAAALALITELIFEGIERLAVPGHLRAAGRGG